MTNSFSGFGEGVGGQAPSTASDPRELSAPAHAPPKLCLHLVNQRSLTASPNCTNLIS